MNKEIHVFRNKEKMADFAIQKWIKLSRDRVKKKGIFSAALSGGETPVKFYEKLAQREKLPWAKTHIFMVDERFVPYESDENNYHLINRTLLLHVSIPPKNIHPILTSESSPQTSAQRYEKEIMSYCKNMRTRLPHMDLMLLGVGGDGHTASLFPGTPALGETRRYAVSVTPGERSKKERITITLPVINGAGNVFFMVTGENKAKVVKELIEDEKSELPAAMVKPQTGKLLFLLDESAASLLSDS